MKSKVLLLGADGLLGTALKLKFTLENFTVVAFDKKDLDVTNHQAVLEKITNLKPDYIINATAYNSVDDIEKNEKSYELALKLNCDAVGYISEAAKILDIPVVHFSTDYVFSGLDEVGYLENSSRDPISRYGYSKLLGEYKLVQTINKYYLVRLSKLFGEAGKSELSKKSFVDVMIDKMMMKEGEIKIVNNEKSCPTYSKDLAEFVYKLILENSEYGIYHGANTGGATWFDLAKEIANIKKSSCNIISIDGSDLAREAKRPEYSILINTKRPQQRTWQEALKEYLSQKTSD